MFGIKQIIPEGFCLKCDGCCRFSHPDTVWSPFLLKEEIDNFLKQGLAPSLITTSKNIRVVSFDKGNIFICALLDPQENKCKIYSFRPFDCQLYPFLINRDGGKIFLAADLRCLFVKENLEKDEFKKHAQYLRGLLNSPDLLNIKKDNPQIAQEYAEVINLFELDDL